MLRENRLFCCVGLLLLLVEIGFAGVPDFRCRVDGGEAECTGPGTTSWECTSAGGLTTSDPPCKRDGYFEGYCKSEEEAKEAFLANELERNPQICAGPVLDTCLYVDEPQEEINKYLGTTTLVKHGYDLFESHWKPDGSCPPPGPVTSCWLGYGVSAACMRGAACPPGYKQLSPGPCRSLKPEACPAGNPIQCAGGKKIQQEVDIEPIDGSGIGLVRYFSSAGFYTPPGIDAPISSLGINWRHTFQQKIVLQQTNSPTHSSMATAVRPSGDYRHFILVDGSWKGRKDSPDRLEEIVEHGQRSGWRLLTADNDLEVYDQNGVLLSILKESGLVLSLTYSSSGTSQEEAPAPGLLMSVTNSKGRSLHFRYDNRLHVREILTTDGATYSYSYDLGDRLVQVRFPDHETRTYKYNETQYTDGARLDWTLLTGIVDENEQRFATFNYNVHGRAIEEWHGIGNVDHLTFKYFGDYLSQENGQTVITNEVGKITRRRFVAVNGILKDGGTDVCADIQCHMITQHDYRTYTVDGNMNLYTDNVGAVTNYTHDDRGRETQRVEAANDSGLEPARRTTQTDWHPLFNVPVQRRIYGADDVLIVRSVWRYNTRGQVTSRCEVDPDVGVAATYDCGSASLAPLGVRQTSYIYCEQSGVDIGSCPIVGLLLSVDGPRTDISDVTTYTYYQTDDASCTTGGACTHRHGDLWRSANALGQITEVVAYDKNGRPTRVRDPNGTLTDYAYSPRGWLTNRTVRALASGSADAGDATTHMDYDGVGNIIKVTEPDGVYLAYTYDDAHRLTDITDALGNAIHYTLDAAGNRIDEATTDAAAVVQRSVHHAYDQLSRLKQTLNAANQPVFDATDSYDDNGNLLHSSDGNGVVTEQQYDPLNRLIATIQDVGGTDPTTAGATTHYSYDALDQLRSVTDPDDLTTHYSYDALGNLTQLDSPDTGISTYTYDAAGNRIGQIDARGITTTYAYDALNRVTGIGYPDSNLNVGYAYDQPDATHCNGSYPVGRLTSMIDAAGRTTYCYDRRGNVLRKQRYSAGDPYFTVGYTYTRADRLASVVYPSGTIITYGHDTVGRVDAVSRGDARHRPTRLVTEATYAPFGPVTGIDYANGRTQTRSYDADYAIQSLYGSPANALTVDYGVDVMGNIKSISTTLAAPAPDRFYAYDAMNRLTRAGSGPLPPQTLEEYTYTPTGDRTSARRQGGSTEAYDYVPGTHRLASVGHTPRSYDANGNTLTGMMVGSSLSYDDRNRLIAAGNADANTGYVYNGRGERIAKTGWSITGPLPPTHYVYSESGRLLGEYDADGAALTEYVYLNRMPVALLRDGSVYYIESDHLGSPRQVIRPGTTAVGDVVVWRWDLLGNSFGEGAPDEDPDGDGTAFTLNLRFPGQYFDAETGLHYNYFRDYEPATGRYVESDPVGLIGDISTYAYAVSNPYRFVDPTGLKYEISCGEECRNCKYVCTSVPIYPVMFCSKVCNDDDYRSSSFYFYPIENRRFHIIDIIPCDEFEKLLVGWSQSA